MGQGIRFSPLEYDQDKRLFDFGGSGVTGLLIAAMNTTGNVFYVDNGNGQAFDGMGDQGRAPTRPLKTLDYAVGRCTANNGDFIIVMPGHAENVSSAGAITCDVAGVTIIGLGEGAARPTFTWNSADNSATWDISAASVGIYNILGICGDDGLTKAFNVTAPDVTIDITWRDPANVEAARCILGNASADRLTIKLKYEGDAVTGNACVAPIQLVGTDGAEIDINFYGIASTAVVNFITTACLNINVRGYMYNSGTTDYSKLVVATIGGCTWSADIFDGAAGHKVIGGSGGAFGTEDVSAIASDLVVTQSDVKVIVSDWATFTTQVSDLTTAVSDIQKPISDLIIAASDTVTAVSDFAVLTSDIQSDLTVIETKATKISSDLIVVQPKITTIASDLVVVMSDVKNVNADTIVIGSDILDVLSDLVVVVSDTTKIESDLADVQSDLVVMDAIIDTIASDLVSVNARVVALASDFLVYTGTTFAAFETILSDFVVKYASDVP